MIDHFPYKYNFQIVSSCLRTHVASLRDIVIMIVSSCLRTHVASLRDIVIMNAPLNLVFIIKTANLDSPTHLTESQRYDQETASQSQVSSLLLLHLHSLSLANGATRSNSSLQTK